MISCAERDSRSPLTPELSLRIRCITAPLRRRLLCVLCRLQLVVLTGMWPVRSSPPSACSKSSGARLIRLSLFTCIVLHTTAVGHESCARSLILFGRATVPAGAGPHRPYGYFLTASSAEVPDDHPVTHHPFPKPDTQNPKPPVSAIRTQFRASLPPSQPPNPDESGTALYAARTPRSS